MIGALHAACRIASLKGHCVPRAAPCADARYGLHRKWYNLHHYLYHPSHQIRTPCTPKPVTLPPLPPTAHPPKPIKSPSPPSLRNHPVPRHLPTPPEPPRPTTTRMSPHPSADSPVFPANRLGPSACGLPQAAAPCADARCPHIHHKRMIRPETTLSSYKTRNLTKKSRVPPLPFGEKQ